MQERNYADSWFARRAKLAKERDVLKLSERLGEIATVIVTLLLIAFFVDHQLTNTGFFTSNFGTTEIVLFYAAGLFGIVTSLARLFVGKRNSVRPLEVFGALLWATAFFWFLWVFPFNFAYLGNALPSTLRFLLSWVPNVLGQFILLVGGIASAGQVIYTVPFYLKVRQLMKLPPTEQKQISLKPTT